MIRKKRFVFFLSVTLTSLFFHYSSQKSNNQKDCVLSKTIERSGDVLQVALPLSYFVHTLLAHDSVGAYQLCLSVANSTVLTWVPKLFIAQKRPNGGKNSMPSGHTSLAFAALTFFLVRYVITFPGLLMINMASFTALSRIYAQWHYYSDIVIGFLIGLFSALFWTKKRTL
jgi:membrane-associated phospholipid phosphatase